MPYATTDDGVRLYFEETGSGHPLIFVHEFAGDCRSFEPQMRHFGKRYRSIAFNARGFPPSEVPELVSSYSQVRAADDILAVLAGRADAPPADRARFPDQRGVQLHVPRLLRHQHMVVAADDL